MSGRGLKTSSTHFMDEESVVEMGGGWWLWACIQRDLRTSSWSFLYVTREALRFTQCLFEVPMHARACTCTHTRTRTQANVGGTTSTSGLLSVLSTRLRESEPLRRHCLNKGDTLQVSRWPQDYFRSPGSRGCHRYWWSSSSEEEAGPLRCSYTPSPCPGKGPQTVFSWIS